jgi:hypothetical protein
MIMPPDLDSCKADLTTLSHSGPGAGRIPVCTVNAVKMIQRIIVADIFDASSLPEPPLGPSLSGQYYQPYDRHTNAPFKFTFEELRACTGRGDPASDLDLLTVRHIARRI